MDISPAAYETGRSPSAAVSAAPVQAPPAGAGSLEGATPFRGGVSGQLRRAAWPTLKYLTQTEVHTFAFSVAANAVLAFFPFVLLLMTLTLRVFHSRRMYQAVNGLLDAHLPLAQDFIVKHLNALVQSHRGFRVVPLIMLLVSSGGVFLPLEVALNQVWGFKKNRSYVANQLVSLGLAFACGLLALASVAVTTANKMALTVLFFGHTEYRAFDLIFNGVMILVATLASAAVFFLIYWLLPNGKVRPGQVLPAAIIAGVLLEIGKCIYKAVLPALDLPESYGPFYVSVSLVFWGFLSGLLLLGGARLAAFGSGVPSKPDSGLLGQRIPPAERTS